MCDFYIESATAADGVRLRDTGARGWPPWAMEVRAADPLNEREPWTARPRASWLTVCCNWAPTSARPDVRRPHRCLALSRPVPEREPHPSRTPASQRDHRPRGWDNTPRVTRYRVAVRACGATTPRELARLIGRLAGGGRDLTSSGGGQAREGGSVTGGYEGESVSGSCGVLRGRWRRISRFVEGAPEREVVTEVEESRVQQGPWPWTCELAEMSATACVRPSRGDGSRSKSGRLDARRLTMQELPLANGPTCLRRLRKSFGEVMRNEPGGSVGLLYPGYGAVVLGRSSSERPR